MSNEPISLEQNARFNIFRALRLDAHEIRHSNFLGWLLDPTETHGQSSLFLDCFVRLVTERSGTAGIRPQPDSLRDAEVLREHDQLDIRVVIPNLRMVIGIENKLFSAEHSNQLARYAGAIIRNFPGWKHFLVYLTLDGEQASDDRWRSLSHREVCAVIAEQTKRLRPSTPSDVRSFIQHYLDLISDLYIQRENAIVAPRSPEIMQTIAGVIESRKGWKLVSRTSSLIECGPVELFDCLPPIAASRSRQPTQWLTLRFHDHGAQGYVGRYWRPSEVSDTFLRNKVLQALVTHGDTTGFRYKAGELASGLAKDTPAFSGDRIQDLRTGRMPALSVLSGLIERELSAIDDRLPAVCDVVRTALRS